MAESYEGLTVSRRGYVLTIEMIPGEHNTTTLAAHRSLSRIFADLNQDDATRVAVLTGQGDVFSGGALILRLIARAESGNHGGWLGVLAEGRKLVNDLIRCEKPVISRINGDAIGFGANLALLTDFPFMLEHAKIADTHITYGMTAGDGGSLIWPLLIGFSRAKHHLFTGDPLTGIQAKEIGLVFETAATLAELDEKVFNYAERLAGQSPIALRTTKMAVNMTLRRLLDGMVESHLGFETLSYLSQDHREALYAIRDSRKPSFEGR